MKKILLIFLSYLLFALHIQAQSINFESIDINKRPNMVYANFGLNFGITTSLGYARGFNILDRKVLILADYSFPLGKDLFDDFKLKTGTQFEIYTIKQFKLASKLYINYKRVDNSLYTSNSFGFETALLLGYYRAHWYLAGEFGFDKAVYSHIQQSDWYLQLYPEAQSKWYTPSGGNFYYGLQGGYSFSAVDLLLRIGMVSNLQFEPTLLPFYGQLEIHYRF